MYITELNPHLLGGSAINSVYSGFLMIQCLGHAVPRPYPLQIDCSTYVIGGRPADGTYSTFMTSRENRCALARSAYDAITNTKLESLPRDRKAK